MWFNFFGSNIKCFEYLQSYAANVLQHQSCTGKLFYYQWPGFHYTLLLVILHGRQTSFGFAIQHLKSEKFLINQVANAIGHVCYFNPWNSIYVNRKYTNEKYANEKYTNEKYTNRKYTNENYTNEK